MVSEHERRLLRFPRDPRAEPRELLGREPAGVTAAARLVVRVDADDPQAMQLAWAIRRDVAIRFWIGQSGRLVVDAGRGPFGWHR